VALAKLPLPDTAKLLAPAPAVALVPVPATAAAQAAPAPQAAPKPSAPPPAAAKTSPAATKPPPVAKPAAEPANPKSANQPAQVQGKVLEEVAPKTKQPAAGATAAHIALGTLAGLAAVLALIAFGWWRQGRNSAA
jgi:hypothetical protein